jgi:Iron-sulfur cluster-binding domain
VSTVRDCDYPWTGFMIWANGTACCCCYGSSAVGDVSKASPESVWNNPTMQSLRASLAAGVVHTVCQSGTCKYVVGSRASEEASPGRAPKPADFDEKWYVAHYFDVRDGIARRLWSSGLDHYRKVGHREFRCRNAGDWKRWIQDQETAIGLGHGYSASLSWLHPARVHENRIVMSFSARNSGSIPWRANGDGSTTIQAGAEAYRTLADVHRTRPMYAYRADLPDRVEPGRAISLELQAPLDDLPMGRSFLIVDMVSDEKQVRLTRAGTKPLVLGVHRDEWTDQVDLVTG